MRHRLCSELAWRKQASASDKIRMIAFLKQLALEPKEFGLPLALRRNCDKSEGVRNFLQGDFNLADLAITLGKRCEKDGGHQLCILRPKTPDDFRQLSKCLSKASAEFYHGIIRGY